MALLFFGWAKMILFRLFSEVLFSNSTNPSQVNTVLTFDKVGGVIQYDKA